MNFNPFSFFRKPPPTVPDPSFYKSTALVPGESTGLQNLSAAAALGQKFSDLAGTANYLQSVILSLTEGTAIPVETEDMSRALSTVYGSVPPAVSIKMYNNLVAADIAALQVDRTLGEKANLESNPFTLSAMRVINQTVEDSLKTSGSYLHQAALLLRYLQGDQLVYANLQKGLAKYPAFLNQAPRPVINTIQLSNVDVSPETQAVLNNYINGMTHSYGTLYQSLTQPSVLDQDIGSVVNHFLSVGTADIMRICSLFSLIKESSIQNAFSDLTSGPSAATFPSILSEVASQHFQLDQLGQAAFAPLRSMSNTIGTSVSKLQAAARGEQTVVRGFPVNTRIKAGPLAGLANNNSVVGQSLGLEESKGAQELTSLLDWSLQQSDKHFSVSKNAFEKLTLRSTQESDTRIQVMGISNSLETLSSLTKAFISEEQKGNIVASQGPNSQLETIGRILANTNTGNKTTYIISNGQVLLTSPLVPEVTPSASRVFKQAGIQTTLSGLTASFS